MSDQSIEFFSNETDAIFYDDNFTFIDTAQHTTTSDRPKEDNTIRSIFAIIFYSLIVLVSLCGNLLVCRVAFGKRKMRTTTNMLIASLACSDLVMTTFNIPFNVARLLLLNWPFGAVLCFLVPFIQTCCVYVSTFTMAVIAVHRWWTVNRAHTNSRNFSCTRLTCIVMVIWLLASLLSLPHAIFLSVKSVKLYGKETYRCRPTYPVGDFNLRRFLSIEAFLTQYLIPLLITLVVYIQIGFIVVRQGRVLAISSDVRRRQQSEAKRRRILMLALVVIVFALCCPFIYCWLNESFRKGAKKFLLVLFKCHKQKQSHAPDVETCHDNEEARVHTIVTNMDDKNGKRDSV